MKTSRKIYIPLVLSVVLAIGLLLGSRLAGNSERFLAKNQLKNKLYKLIKFIEQEYIDDINTDSIVDLTVDKILENLDPHSVYIDKSQWVAASESLKGDFVGIGINFYMHNDTVAVVKTVSGSPSEKSGLKAGDRILYADTYQLFNKKLPTDTLFSKFKGRIGTKVMLTVWRKSEKKKFKINIERGVIPIKSVDAALKISEETGYIKISRFAETTYDEFAKGLAQLKKQGIKKLIIDVRGNGGGYMEMATEIADEVLKKNRLIVSTKDKKGSEEKVYATEFGDFEEGSLFILIDENSASASEILAGAVQDNDRGTIVGRRSFGKGLVQREMPLGDGSAVRLTVARYYTPSGRSIQKPYKEGKENYFNEFEKRFASGELYAADSIKVADSLKFKTKNGRVVYGGGGIIPDIFVPLENNHAEEATLMILQSGLVDYFVFEELDKNRSFFEKLPKNQLKTELFSNGMYLENFKKYIEKTGFSVSYKRKEKILTYIYAEFLRQLYGEDESYRVLLSQDEMIKRVLTESQNP